jgi:Transglycosylase SLT domain
MSRDQGRLGDGPAPEFFAALRVVCADLGCAPLDMLGLMMRESGVRPTAQHHLTKAAGLIQLMPATLKRLGWGSSPEEFVRVSAAQQLAYVYRYFAPYARHGLDSAGRLYQATFLPATLSHGPAPGTVVCAEEGPFADAYAANAGLDIDGDGAITVGDLTALIDRHRVGSRWNFLVDRLAGVH